MPLPFRAREHVASVGLVASAGDGSTTDGSIPDPTTTHTTQPSSARPRLSPQTTGLLALAIATLFFSSAWPLTKQAIAAGTTPSWFGAGRAGLSCLGTAVLLGVVGRFRMPGRADVPAILAVGLLQVAGYFALAHEAVAWVSAGRTAILANTTTVWIVPLSLLVLHEAIPARRWLAAGLGLAGIAVLASPWSIDWGSLPVVVGHLFLLGAALSWSVAIVVTRLAPPVLSMLQLLPWCFLVASALLVPLAWLYAPDGSFGTQPISWFALGFIGFIAGPVGTWGVMEATARLPAMVSSIGFLATPAISLILANLFLGERFTADLLLGAGLIMAGVVCAAWPGKRVR